MNKKKYCFIDRDGTLIVEPENQQVNSLEKFQLMPNVIPALRQLQSSGFTLVMVSNQDGLGTDSFPAEDFEKPQQLLLDILNSQGILFSDIHICPHIKSDNCTCRKPKVGLLQDYLVDQRIDKDNSFVIGDRESDLALANNLGIQGLLIKKNWSLIAKTILQDKTQATAERKTNETSIVITLMRDGETSITTGIGFFDHMLEQLVKHSGINADISVTGDLHIDDHHTVEDTAITLGMALKKLLGDKHGLQRYGFVLPMDEAQAQIAIDLSGRPYCVFNGGFNRNDVGGLSTECVPHFFQSLSQSLGASIQIDLRGDNTHHMIEAVFKGVGRALRQAMVKDGVELPSTKGVL